MYLPRDRSPNSERHNSPRENIGEFVETRRPDSPSDSINYRILRTRALRSIAENEEVFADYGTKYVFNTSNL